ncbi:MAG TPA: dihydrofolate reductase family protein [Humisphaera sp.]
MQKPHVICHMVTTIDGRILSDRWGGAGGGRGAGNLFERTAASFKIPAWLVGTTTMKEFSARGNLKLKPAAVPVPPGDHLANLKTKNFAIAVDAKSALRFTEPEVDGDHVVLLIPDTAPADYRAHLRAVGVSYLVCGKAEVSLPRALDKLRTLLGIKKLMLQGGGLFNGTMLKAGLVDEISQVILPLADGGVGVSTIFDIPGPPPRRAAAKLRPFKHQTLPNGVHWLRYKVVGKVE